MTNGRSIVVQQYADLDDRLKKLEESRIHVLNRLTALEVKMNTIQAIAGATLASSIGIILMIILKP